MWILAKLFHIAKPLLESIIIINDITFYCGAISESFKAAMYRGNFTACSFLLFFFFFEDAHLKDNLF